MSEPGSSIGAVPERVSPPSGRGAGLMERLRTLFGRRNGDNLRETIEELIEVAEPAATDQPIDEGERALLRNILGLHEVSVADVMVPRALVVAVEVSTPFADLVRVMGEMAHSRLPIYRDDLDHVVGMVHLKDVVAAIGRGEAPSLESLCRKPLFVPPSIGCLTLLAQMRQARTHLALVVDEYGGIDGLVTIEDLVEQIVGEIEDEHEDTDDQPIELRPDGTLLTHGYVPVAEITKLVGPFLSDDERDAVDTVGGLVFHLAGRVPDVGETLTHASGVTIEVLTGDRRRVDRLRLGNLPTLPAA
jgi:CBS domain containing-hemolysin-like protein